MNNQIRTLLLLLVFLLLPACNLDIFHGWIQVDHLRPMSPVPTVYAYLHKQVEECTGMSRSFDDIEWKTASSIEWEGKTAAGMWGWPNDNTIIIKESWVEHFPTIRHELEHYIRQVGNSAHDEHGELPCQY